MNTGNQVVVNLKKKNLTTGALTGEVKPNIPGDPDYVEPGLNLAACPVDTALSCPVVKAAKLGADGLIYEFSLPSSVLANANFTRLDVVLSKASDNSTVATQTFLSFTPNYFQGTFPGLTLGETYKLNFLYRNALGVQIGGCEALTSVTLDALVSWQPADGSCQLQTTCADGWTLDTTGTQCIQVLTMAPNQPTGNGGTPGTAVAVTNAQWNNGGAAVYAQGYPLSGDGTVQQRLLVPHLWVNGNTTWDSTGRNTVDSRMNAAGVWATVGGDPLNEWIGFARQVTTNVAKTVYIGMSADNMYRFALNGVDIVNNTGNVQGSPNFNYWNIYPVDLPSGVNYIELYGKNTSGPGGVAMEIYDCTLEQLTAVTTEVELNQYIIFSSRDVRGQEFNLGQTVGYSCNQGWVLDNSDPDPANWVCKQISRQAPITSNTGMLVYATRYRLASGVPDGYSEPNIDGSGLGPYFPPVQDLVACPTNTPQR